MARMLDTLFPPKAIKSQSTDALPVTFVHELHDMSAALAPDQDAAIWARTVPPKVQQWLDFLPARNLPSGRFVLSPVQVAACMRDLFKSTSIPASPALDWLCEDAGRLAQSVAQLDNTDLVRLRVERIVNNACSKLHIDNVVARLICTYRGQGTALGLDPKTEAQLQTVPTGLPILLKGKQWPGARMPSLHHRSPAIEGTGESRLVLVLEGCTEKDIFPAYDTIYQS